MSASLVIRSQAVQDLHDAAKWYESQSDGLGREFVSQVDLAMNSACLMPLRFPEVHDGIRRTLVKRFPYGVYFRCETETNRVIVFAIMHLHRDPKRWQTRNE
ncbi:MAG: type II toxin-antitoxin system RelE/ParE family toxin [Phycisphaeraceae bacterium]